MQDRIAFDEVEEFFDDMAAEGTIDRPREDFESDEAYDFYCDLCQDLGMARSR